jgi:sulfotransferase family protein
MKVLYIAGWGRSGTTILDNILGSYDSVFSAGELFYLWRRGLHQRRPCGCGARLTGCRTWQNILDVAYAGDKLNPKRTAALQRRAVRVRHTRRLSRAELTEEAAEYRDEMRRVYTAIGAVTGAELIVDSSKVPSGAAVLAQIPEIESYLVHMIRDPRAVAFSWTRATDQPGGGVAPKMAPHSAVDSTANWTGWNLLIEGLARDLFAGRSRRLRYEDFVAGPRDTVESLLDLAGMKWSSGPFQDSATVQLPGNHTVSGNPSRFRTGTVALCTDEEWRYRQPWRQRAASTAMSLPLLRHYGYSIMT